MPELLLPNMGRGRPTAKKLEEYSQQLQQFADLIKSIVGSINFKVTIRGLCYLLEGHGLDKNDFPAAQTAINKCRRTGLLPIDVVIEESRDIDGIFYPSFSTPEEYAHFHLNRLREVSNYYRPLGLWDNQSYFPILAVEKIDLKSL